MTHDRPKALNLKCIHSKHSSITNVSRWSLIGWLVHRPWQAMPNPFSFLVAIELQALIFGGNGMGMGIGWGHVGFRERELGNN